MGCIAFMIFFAIWLFAVSLFNKTRRKHSLTTGGFFLFFFSGERVCVLGHTCTLNDSARGCHCPLLNMLMARRLFLFKARKVKRAAAERACRWILLALIPLRSPLPLLPPRSDGAHDGDDVGGWAGGVRPQCPADLRRVRRQGHRLPLQRHDVRRLQRILQVWTLLAVYIQPV